MQGTFYRWGTDGTKQVVPLDGVFAGTQPSACWLLGGGPSLTNEVCAEIATTAVPRMGVNLAGSGIIRPTFWTSYDPTQRFHRSIYLDAGIMKFLHRRRAMDVAPDTNAKVCECPNTYFFDRDANRDVTEPLSTTGGTILDWADSMVQGIDILYRLGFRKIYLAGCDLKIGMTEEQRLWGTERGVNLEGVASLTQWSKRCSASGLTRKEQASCAIGRQYHFDEDKAFAAALATDGHYFRIVQYLRLSRRALGLAGLQLTSVTAGSRLNDYFPYRPLQEVVVELQREFGDFRNEPTRGLYTGTSRASATTEPMEDVRPPGAKKKRDEPFPRSVAPVVDGAAPDQRLGMEVEHEGWEPGKVTFSKYLQPVCEEG